MGLKPRCMCTLRITLYPKRIVHACALQNYGSHLFDLLFCVVVCVRVCRVQWSCCVQQLLFLFINGPPTCPRGDTLWGTRRVVRRFGYLAQPGTHSYRPGGPLVYGYEATP